MATASIESDLKAQVFRLRTPLLSAGRSHTILASSKGEVGAMNVAIKCYAEGGENEFHAHAKEDHTFIVLQGRARFHQPDQPPRELGRNEGILLPAGALYKFETASDEPLILLRVGNVWQPVAGDTAVDNSGRQDTQGAAFGAHTKANKGSKGVPIPGAFYE
ncbi:MAG: cupin domain-containing protein [Xanthobacteraceae bacterium]|nr:cupin domain-containing protein [Xanthobacteraceae bacterium]